MENRRTKEEKAARWTRLVQQSQGDNPGFVAPKTDGQALAFRFGEKAPGF
jgi:hypothetical protein